MALNAAARAWIFDTICGLQSACAADVVEGRAECHVIESRPYVQRWHLSRRTQKACSPQAAAGAEKRRS